MAPGRRLAAIMFADMVGYSALTQRDEPLALRLFAETETLLRPFFAQHGGREVKTLGDAFLVEFESALNATECAIAMQRRLFERNQGPDAHRVDMRVGIHLGDVVHQGTDVVGDTVNIASRIEPLAEASGICISGAVLEQVGNKIPFACTRLDQAFLQNINTPITVHSIELPWHAPPASRVTPWTNRVDELATIEAAVADATRGTGQAVALAGEPGIGKTRLAEEAIRHAERAGFRVLRGRGFEDELRAPYALFVESVRSFLRDAPKSLLDRVSEHCASEILSLVPELRDRLGPVPPGPELDPEAARLQFFEGITRFFQNLAREAPLLLLLDDLQWADPGSLALLEYLGPRIQDHRLLLLLTYRDVEAEPGGALHKVLSNLRRARFLREVVLRRFDVGAVRQLVEAILGSDDPVPELIPLLVEKSGGNPFFVEELLRSLIEEGILLRTVDGWQRKALAKIEIPSTVREVLRRRVERVGKEAVAVLAVASVFGGEFGFDLLRRVSGVEEEKLLHLVEAMLRARLLREREVSPGVSVLRFNDEQIRDVLYGEMSAVRRRRYHGQAAEALESMRRALPRFAALPMSTMV